MLKKDTNGNEVKMNNSHGFLKFATGVFKVLAWIAIISGALCTIVILNGGTPTPLRWTGAVTLITGFAYLFIFLTISEVIKLLLDIKMKLR